MEGGAPNHERPKWWSPSVAAMAQARVRSLTLVEPAAYWILEQLGDGLVDVGRVNSLVHGLFGRPVTGEDLAEFLELAGFVESARDVPSHPNWDRRLSHRMALSWQGEALDHPERAVGELSSITCPVLLTKGTRTADWLKRVVDVLGERPPKASVVEFDAFLHVLGGASDADPRRPAGVSERASQSYRGAAEGTSTSTPTTADRAPAPQTATVARHAAMVQELHRTSYTYDGAADPSEPGGRALDVRELLFHESCRAWTT